MRVTKPPAKINIRESYRGIVFLAGSIEMGAAEDWQSKVTEELSDIRGLLILNPRRDDWDSSWEQSIDNPQFYEQVTWELDGLTLADTIIMYLAPNTKSPISLLELGLYIHSRMYVCCPKGFWRKGNVDIVCERHSVPMFENLDDLLKVLRADLGIKPCIQED